MSKKNGTASIDSLRDMDEENEDEGLDKTRTYLFNIMTTVAIRAGDLDEAEEILEEEDYEDSPNIRIVDQDIQYVGED